MSREKGATLLEVLVALAITALIAATVTQMTGFGLRTVERAQTASSTGAGALADERRLRDALSALDRGGFAADADGFRWRGPGPSAAADAWRLSRNGDIAPCFADRCDSGAPWIAGRIEAISFAGGDGVFSAEWRGDAPPHLIRIDLVGRAIVIAPRIRGLE